MNSKINNRFQLLKNRRKELFKEYDETKDKIKRVLSDDVLNVAFDLLQKLELINVEIEGIDKELDFLKTL